MSTFDDREQGFENKFKHDNELEFRIGARRNRLLGLWAAQLLGIHGVEAENYARNLAELETHTPGDRHTVISKVLEDFKLRGIEMSEHRLRRHMDELGQSARNQIMTEA
ncbi:MAG TPA: DUF1476 domain-containing protein [Terriglobales bacterium]|jgi:hypothetical protein|nr:DUF1476 domain-containing protein [Terriglobales bacterium]